MNEGIKRMLAERAADEKRQSEERKKQERLSLRWERIRAVTFAKIDRAASFIDQDCPPNKWPPSKLLKILYCVSASAPRPDAIKDAIPSILDMLDLARKRFLAGVHPNPFLGELSVNVLPDEV